MGKRVGYGRVSSKGQEKNGNSLEDQKNLLAAEGCDEIILETYTGTRMDRPKFTKMLEGLESGDTLIVTKLDRFARTTQEGLEVVQSLKERGVKVHILNMGLIENTPTGDLILTVMLAFAQFERACIVERTQAGKAIAKENDPNFKEGRPYKEVPEFETYAQWVENGEITVSAACNELGISRTKWYKLVKEIYGRVI